MRRILPIVVLSLSVALLATGCDFFRSLAGRPTSRDIASMREDILRHRADSVARADSIRIAAETVAAEESQEPEQAPAAKPGKKRFYVIMGAFSNEANAQRCASALKERGYETEFFGFTEGRTAVGIGGTDDPQEAKTFFDEIRRQDFCPAGVWILDRKRK